MDLGTVFSAAQTIFQTLQCSELRELFSILGYTSELKKLERTVSIAKAVLDDADSKQKQVDLHRLAQLYIDELKDVVYDAEDLLHGFATLAQRKLRKDDHDSKKRKVSLLFARFNPLASAYKMSRGIKEIRQRLDNIANYHIMFGFKPNFQPNSKLANQPTRWRKEETCSYVRTQDIIGREDDVEKIVGRLLDPVVQQDVCCLAIVGIGGLGKTTLAQLVFNDPRIKENFPVRLWTCVFDEDAKGLDFKATLCKILHSATRQNHENLAVEHLQTQIQEQLAGKKYFLVLDDVWNENRLQWNKLAKFLMSGLRGSWIVVTTLSEKTSTIVGDEHPHKLEGLSDVDSWRLFEMSSFGHMHGQIYPAELVEIGREIVKRYCANVPFSITTIGSFLHDQGKEKWVMFREMGLHAIKQDEDGDIKTILKHTYHNLNSSLKTCFSYCALFPKDYDIEKEMLINMWIAHDYIVPLKGQSIEDLGEEYFSILLRRGFFRDVRIDVYGEIKSCKVHNLMHDIAQEVAGKEIHVANSIPCDLNSKVRHLSYNDFANHFDKKSSLPSPKIRTFVHIGVHSQRHLSDKDLCTLLANSICLRALGLSHLDIKRLPSTLGKLVHLRYLDLSNNRNLEALPYPITNLRNLETLRLVRCMGLRELPIGLSKLTKLRVLDTSYCESLASMPRGIGKLSCLQKLPLFVVGNRTSGEKRGLVDQLQQIKALKNLKGVLFIQIGYIPADATYFMENGTDRGYLSQHQYLTEIAIGFPKSDFDEALWEELKPHPNVRGLKLQGYFGGKMPNWAREENLTISLPNLVSIKLEACRKLQHLEMLGKLRKLKSLALEALDGLEYIENTTMSRNSSGVGALESQESFFPSLEQLELYGLPKLKGWWRDDGNTNQEHGLLLPSFPSVSKLKIRGCPNLASMPLCPNVEELAIYNYNVNLRIMGRIESGNSKLRSVKTDTAGHLKLVLPLEAFQCLKAVVISWDDEVESLSEVKDVFCSCSSSLRELQIQDCDKLKIVNGGLEHLTALESLVLYSLPHVSLSKAGEGEGGGYEEGEGEEDIDYEMPWHCLHHSLRSLELNDLPKMVKLPDGMRYLTALQSLSICSCKELESVPEWMPELTSLKTLWISDCSEGLSERCRKPTGEDWPNIQHISDIYIS